MKATVSVNAQQRYAKMRAHTATHLLHFALDELLDGTKQAGSLVDEDYLRFDFAAKEPLTQQQIHQLESKINHWINHSLPVHVEETTYDQAIKQGAKAFFEDKYGDTVRVVSIRDQDVELSSIELCGGTHVKRTSDIGACLITGQESVASGIRRITAVTGCKVALRAQKMQQKLLDMSDKLGCQPKQLDEKIDKLLTEKEELQRKYDKMREFTIRREIVAAFEGDGATFRMGSKQLPVFVLNLSESALKTINFKIVVNQTKEMMHMHSWIIYNDEGNFAVHATKESFSAKDFAAAHKLRGGGSDQLVQGKDPKIKEIIKQATDS